MNAKNYDVVVVGAGVSGLAVAIRLRLQNRSVLVLEKNETYGGKLDQLKWNGFTWDKGPSLFTMPEYIQDLFTASGKDMANYFQYERQEATCHYFYDDGVSFQLFEDKAKCHGSIARGLDEEAAEEFDRYLETSRRIYDRIGGFFLDRPQFSAKDFLKKEMLVRYPFFLTKPMRKSLHEFNFSQLKSKHLVQLADRYGTYNGSNPYKMGGIYALIPHLEQNLGTFFPKNGMRSIPEALYVLSLELGVEYAFNTSSIDITKATDGAYQVYANNSSLLAKKVVCAIDHLRFYQSVFKDDALLAKYKKQERSSSAIVFYWAINEVHENLGLHNIFFGNDYEEEFAQIFSKRMIPVDPTVYVHISAVVNAKDAPAGKQNWFVMVNTPAGIYPSPNELDKVKNFILEKLKKHWGIDVSNKIEFEDHWLAQDLESRTGAVDGALYGASSNAKMAALNRHPNSLKKHKNLYFCGGTVHPGGGIPLALKSAEIVANIAAHEN